MKRFIVCIWKPKPGEEKGFRQSVEIWNSETVKKTASLDYGILSTEFNGEYFTLNFLDFSFFIVLKSILKVMMFSNLGTPSNVSTLMYMNI